MFCNVCITKWCVKDLDCKAHPPHAGGSCNQDAENEEKFKAMIESKEIQYCPTCRVVTYKDRGCGHIACTCGAHWCWICGTM